MYSFGRTQEENDAVLVFTGRLELILHTFSTTLDHTPINGITIDYALRKLGRDAVISPKIRKAIIDAELKNSLEKKWDNSANNHPYIKESPVWDELMKSDIFTPFYVNLFMIDNAGLTMFEESVNIFRSILEIAEKEKSKLNLPS
jgi:hypothetical protein